MSWVVCAVFLGPWLLTSVAFGKLQGNELPLPRSWCGAEGGWSVEVATPTEIQTGCATLKQLLAEINRFSEWTLDYTGPEAEGELMGSVNPQDLKGVLRMLDADWNVRESSRDEQLKIIHLKPTRRFEPGEIEPALQVSEAILKSGSTEAPVPRGTCATLIQEGDSWVWCRHVTVAEGIAAFNRISAWQIDFADPPPPNLCISFFYQATDLSGMEQQLRLLNVREGARSESEHRVILVRRGDPLPYGPLPCELTKPSPAHNVAGRSSVR